jgi:predicted adenylyl cyclase CyaB
MNINMCRADNEKMPFPATEIEVKVLEINRADVEARLSALGAKMVFVGNIHALYYDFPDQRLKRSGLTLRLRMEGRKAVLTLKTDISNAAAKEREELQTEINDFAVMQQILETMGFSAWLVMKKHRTSYELPDAHVEIDRYQDDFSYIPEFLEIEGKDTHAVYRVAEALGFRTHDCKPWDAVELAAYYRDRNRMP